MTRSDGRIPLFTRLITAARPAGAGAQGSGDTSFAQVRRRAREAEAAGIDALLLADRHAAAPDPADDPHFEAGTLAAALAVSTTSVGIVPSVCTEHAFPYHVARALATLDHLGAGRGGWQPLVHADPDAAANYHREPSTAPERHARATEFAEVLTGLWDSFDDDAFLRDRASGAYFVPERLHALDHAGEYFDVAGPLNIARPPQAHPPLVQRATDPGELALAARIANVVLLPAHSAGEAKAVRDDLREQARRAGRNPDEVLVLLDWPADGATGAADDLLAVYEAEGADGFTLYAPSPDPDAAHDAVLSLAAEVRRTNGGPATPPGPATLRDRLGLTRPAGRHGATV
ncbi:LLM class flavin-dependent oxidoreductase [Streptomyces sp. NPDC090445]|uniref:LLM class flavin-dependent oxidoreductase n=1 Tax=Streptomyces sp. NPDC090445 TaxID=3365963 RepID=UPI00380EA367